MQIKEVEKQTGLTAKSIRHYEAKGLLSVERNEENSYRNYTEENVHQLKRIKIFRYLGFSIEEIQKLQEKDITFVKGALEEKAEEYSEMEIECNKKRDLCLTLSTDMEKDAEVWNEYQEVIHFIEGDEFNELQEELMDMSCPSISQVIVSTMIFLGPVLGLLFHLQQVEWWSYLLALGAAVCLTLNWRNYFYRRKYQKKRIKKQNQRTFFVIPIMILGIVLAILAVVGVMVLQEKMLAPADWLFYEIDQKMGWLLVIIVVFPVIYILAWLADFLDKSGKWRGGRDIFLGINFVLRHKVIMIVLWVVCLYFCFTSVTFVTKDRIICHSPFNPSGISYGYDQVIKTEARFGSKRFSLWEYERKGNFSYTVELGGRRVIFSVPTPNEEIEKYEDSYLELEEFDQALMKLGVPKEGSLENQENCTLDQRYVDRFGRIVENGMKS